MNRVNDISKRIENFKTIESFKPIEPQAILTATLKISELVMEYKALEVDKLEALIERMAARDESALAALYDATLAKVYGLALKITRRHDLAEEVVEDTYWQVWQEAVRFDSVRGSVMAWMMTICRSRALDLLRKQDEAESYADPAELMQEMPSDAAPLSHLLTLERDSALYVAMNELSPIQRQMLAMAFFKGSTHEEIALQMQMALGTVKSHIKRALTLLKEALKDSEEYL